MPPYMFALLPFLLLCSFLAVHAFKWYRRRCASASLGNLVDGLGSFRERFDAHNDRAVVLGTFGQCVLEPGHTQVLVISPHDHIAIHHMRIPPFSCKDVVINWVRIGQRQQWQGLLPAELFNADRTAPALDWDTVRPGQLIQVEATNHGTKPRSFFLMFEGRRQRDSESDLADIGIDDPLTNNKGS